MPNGDRARASVIQNGVRRQAGNGAMTRRQEEILLYCERKGYYEIPRRKTLRALAADLAISVTSLSLIIRRAEAKLVQDYVLRERSGARSEPTARPRSSTSRQL